MCSRINKWGSQMKKNKSYRKNCQDYNLKENNKTIKAIKNNNHNSKKSYKEYNPSYSPKSNKPANS